MKIGIEKFKDEMDLELKELLAWWMTNMPDPENGGFYGKMDGYGNLQKYADKGIILNTRLLWTFSAASLYRIENTELIAMADRAYQYLISHFLDNEYGGFFWSVDYQGQVIDTTKQIYAQAFAVYALCVYYDLTRKVQALDLAWQTVRLIEKHGLDSENGGYFNVFDLTWNPILSGALSEKDIPADKIMNTHLHILEAYTQLHISDPKPESKVLLNYILNIYSKKIYNSRTDHTIIYLDRLWNPLTSEISFGHDIESSWLMMEAADSLKEEKIIQSISDIALKLATRILEEGRDNTGGILEKTDASGVEIEKEKHWWPQAEAVVGFLNAYQISQQPKFLEAAITAWECIKKYFKDNTKGEWHWMIDEENKPVLSEEKAGPWKAPYHNVRMCLEVLKRLNHLD